MRLRDLGLFSLKRRKLSRYLTAVFSYLMDELLDRQTLPRDAR